MADDDAIVALVRSIDARLMEHERECDRQRTDAKRDRHDFRAEVAGNIHRLGERIDAGFEAIHARISSVKNKGTSLVVAVLAGAVVALGGLSLFLLKDKLGW